MMLKENRNNTIDVVRGIAMIAVVLGHCGFPFTQHLYLFHMAAFLFVSGYCFNKKNYESLSSLKSFFGRKIISLYLPYAIFTALVLFFFNNLIDIGIMSNNPNAKTPVDYRAWWKTLNGILSSFHFEAYAAEQLCGAAWFVIVLIEIVFFVSITYWILKLIIRNEHIRNVIMLGISIYFLNIGNYLRMHNLILNDFLSSSCSCLVLYLGGYLVKEYLPDVTKEWIDKVWISLPILNISIIGLIIEEKHGHISLGSNAYPSPIFLILCTSTGLLMLFSLAHLLKRVSWIERAVAYIGRHTMFILFLHFIAFKLINWVQILVYHKEWYELATFPHLKTEHGWWIAYAVVGIGIPLLINVGWEMGKSIVIKLDNRK